MTDPTQARAALREALRVQIDRVLTDAHGVPEYEREAWAERFTKAALAALPDDGRPRTCGCRADTAQPDICAECGHREHGRSGCGAALPDDGREGLRKTGEGLPEGAMLSVMGPTATPSRRFVALIMDHPSEYTSRTLSIGFGDSMETAAADARTELDGYDAETWPYRNKTLDDAVELARLARFRAALVSADKPSMEGG